MIPIIIESPYSGDIARNQTYLIRCIRHSLNLGEAPIASHQMYTTALDEDLASEREHGILAGYAWWPHARLIAFYTDYGYSKGMNRALLRARDYNFPAIYRMIGTNEDPR